ncbi:hypothetical protein TGME49_313540 [Toxoplasma gondii ME49]|uniref:Transmembrane protein n=2 Tax=Toxoplasma gondii TaxID=5811 RepID=A0A125YGS5_TOXGV|nr:hypothetical protein TGME49_313540 [Toxoplasma gondii ME49]EPT25905.1 hypothetical protein TGME49_313540 [Toxoplasma gondii ME49]ESS35132.1 putative transmembrane protein [Toxoplasma gondii VEG]|eukprot:XP_018635417.1 hypothetical protein TGME49_313540 [Toxoplasma gondii ME49]
MRPCLLGRKPSEGRLEETQKTHRLPPQCRSDRNQRRREEARGVSLSRRLPRLVWLVSGLPLLSPSLPLLSPSLPSFLCTQILRLRSLSASGCSLLQRAVLYVPLPYRMASALSSLRGCLVWLPFLLVFAGLSARVAALRAPSASPLATIPGPPHLPGVHTPAPPRSHIGASHPAPLPSSSGANASLSSHGGSATKSGPASSLREAAITSWSGVDTPEAAGTFEAAREEGSVSSGVSTPQMSSPVQQHGESPDCLASAPHRKPFVRSGPSTFSSAFSPLFEGEAQRQIASSFSTFLPTPSGKAWLPTQGLFQAFSDPDNGWGVRLSFPTSPCSLPASAFFSLHAAVHPDADPPRLGQGEKALDNEAGGPRGDTTPPASAETAGVQSATHIGGAGGGRRDARHGMVSGEQKTHAPQAHEDVSAKLCASPAVARGTLERSVSSDRETSGIRGDIEAPPLYSVSFSAPTDELWGENVVVCMHWSEPSSSSLSAHEGHAEALQPAESRGEPPRRDVGVGVEWPRETSAKQAVALAFGRVPDACVWGRATASRGGNSRDTCAKPQVEVAVEGGRRTDQHTQSPSRAGVVFAETDEARETTGKESEQASSLSLPVLHAAPRMLSLNGVYDVHLALPLRLSPPAGASRPHGDASGAGMTGQVADANGEVCEGHFRKDSGSYDDGGDGQGWRTATGRRKHTGREVGERRTGAGILAGAQCTDSGAEGGGGRWGRKETERGGMDVQMGDAHALFSREQGSVQAMSSLRRNLSSRRRFTKADIKEALKSALVVVKTKLSGGCEGPYSSQALALTSLRASVPLVASRLQSAVGGGNKAREQKGQHDGGRVDGDRSGKEEPLGDAREFSRQGPAREDPFVDVTVPLELSIRGEDLPVDLALCLYTSRLDTDPLPLGLVQLAAPPPLSDAVLSSSGLSRQPAETRAFSGAAQSESQRFGQNTIRGRDTRTARETLEPQAPVAAIAGTSIPAKAVNWLAAQLSRLNVLRRSSEGTAELEETLRPAGVDESESASWWERAFAFAASLWGGAQAAARGSTDSFAADAEERETEAEEDFSRASHADASWAVYAPFAVLVGAAAGYILTLHWQARAKMQEARAKTCTGPCCSDAPSDWLAIRSSLRATHALSSAHLSPFSSSLGEARASEGGSRRPNRRPKASLASSLSSSSQSADASGVSAASPPTRKSLTSSRRSRRPIAAPAELLTPSRRIYETLWGEEEILRDRRPNGGASGLGASPWQWPEEGSTRSGRRKHERRPNEVDTASWPISY